MFLFLIYTQKHAKALGQDTAKSLVRDLFNRQTQKDLGVRLWLPPREQHDDSSDKTTTQENDDRPMWLMAPLSKQRAHRMASQAGVLQFESPSINSTASNDDDDDGNRMQHTGILRIRNKDKIQKNKKRHLFVPLSAALRVSPREVDTAGVIQNGSIHDDAVVFSLDQMGDGGSPLMTLSLNPTRGQVRDRMKLKAAGKRHFSQDKRVQVLDGDLKCNFDNLRVGDGPIKAKVMRMSTRSGAAFVDCGVGRSTKDGNTRVLGMLRFDDLVQSALKQDDDDDESSTVEFRSEMSEDEAQLIEDAMYDDDEEEWDDEDHDDEAMTVEDLTFFADDDGADDDTDEDDIDITDLLTVGDDGVVSYQDPETGKTVIVSEMDVGGPSDDDESDSDSMFTGLSPEERLALLTKVVEDGDVEHSHDHTEEEEMDITHLISTENGVMSYKDPETGESVVISDESIDEDEDEASDDDDDDEEDDLFKNMSPEERLDMISRIMNDREVGDGMVEFDDNTEEITGVEESPTTTTTRSTSSDSFKPAFVQVGDEIDVYIKSVYKQSGRFMVTLDPAVKGRKAKDMKKESEAEKKLARLAEKLGGLERILELEGTECDGIVQAVSNTGDWCYVWPSVEDLPVGVAKLSSDDIQVAKGDSVRVRMDGIDESRGQLAMTVI